MVRLKVTMDNEMLAAVASRLSSLSTAQSMPATAKAMKTAAALVRATWQGYATGQQTLPGVEPMKNPSKGYADGIKVNPLGPFDYEIVNPSEIAEYLEHGTTEIDMKQTHTRGPRSRVSRKGVPYLIVPFRWGTPKNIGARNVMPQAIYDIVKKARFEKSLVAGTTHNEKNASGEAVSRNDYEKWGDRLNIEQIIHADDVGMNLNQMFNMSGMVRMDTSTENQKYSGYYTFRVISANGKPGSWIKPATPARHITDGVVRAVQEDVDAIIETAVIRDLGL